MSRLFYYKRARALSAMCESSLNSGLRILSGWMIIGRFSNFYFPTCPAVAVYIESLSTRVFGPSPTNANTKNVLFHMFSGLYPATSSRRKCANNRRARHTFIQFMVGWMVEKENNSNLVGIVAFVRRRRCLISEPCKSDSVVVRFEWTADAARYQVQPTIGSAKIGTLV